MTTLANQLRRSVSSYLERTGMSARRLSRWAVGDSAFVSRLNRGHSTGLNTADRLLEFMGEPAIGPMFRREVEAFISVKGISESRFGTEAAGDDSFVKRLRDGVSFRLATVDRVRTWMRNAMGRAERAAVSRLIESGSQAEPGGSSPGEHPPEYHREAFLSARQAAAFLTLSSETLHRFRETGGGPAYCEFGNRILYSRADLLVWAWQMRQDPLEAKR